MSFSPILRFDFLSPARVLFGWGRRSEIGAAAQSLGNRVFFVLGSKTLKRTGLLAEIEASLSRVGVVVEPLAQISREPEPDDVDTATERLRGLGPGEGDLIVAVGGGSAIDLGKAVAVLATNRQGHSVTDFLEGVGKGLKIERPGLPVVAVPTTAGTGSEATKNAVISSARPPFKRSLRSDYMIPRVVVIDPELTQTASSSVTAHTGMDAITQLIESYLSRRAQPIPQGLARSGLEAALPAIVSAVEKPTDRTARERMAYAAFLSGLALANSGLGMAHGVAAALGSVCGVAHGLACAVMLPVALRVNREVCQKELAELWSLVDRDSTLREGQAADRFIEHIERIAQAVGVPERLSAIGVTRQHIPALVQGSRGSSMDGNPRDLDDSALQRLLEEML
jgi:alcohol dehydrogenase